ncbi:DNA-binding transcriptional MerR regulator [Kribbella antiqua]|uniref:DNA-binding transcriptional MerR regulator n=1 Tax=Kribbella antiqua TaxID=2512217 RepID=A0A4R2J492_9ACTN|nr:MerR family transcriptional regulator [Kribbella antiqua]TCO51568.1 DNA-binding transcriptional MerR regulator [Kribbella antiqua]
MDLSIGELARRARLSVKTVRYYSDQGLLPSRRTAAGHRRYDGTAVARLDLIRTLRALGIDLPTVRRVLDQERSLADVATAHAEALAVQIRTLRLRHAVLTVAARRHSPEELELMNTLIADFLSSTLGDDPNFAAMRQNLTPVLPDDADAVQVGAWLELAALVQDEDFRAAVRRLAAGYRRIAGDALWHDPELRDRLSSLRDEADPRWHRYLELLAVINGWAAPSRMAG